MSMSVQMLREFIVQTSEELRAVDSELQPLLQREREIKQALIDSCGSQVVEIESVEALEWMGHNCAGQSVGYRVVEHIIRAVDYDARAVRAELYDEWTWLRTCCEPRCDGCRQPKKLGDGGGLGCLRERRRGLHADREAAQRRIDELEEQAKAPPKPKPKRKRSGQMSLL